MGNCKAKPQPKQVEDEMKKRVASLCGCACTCHQRMAVVYIARYLIKNPLYEQTRIEVSSPSPIASPSPSGLVPPAKPPTFALRALLYDLETGLSLTALKHISIECTQCSCYGGYSMPCVHARNSIEERKKARAEAHAKAQLLRAQREQAFLKEAFPDSPLAQASSSTPQYTHPSPPYTQDGLAVTGSVIASTGTASSASSASSAAAPDNIPPAALPVSAPSTSVVSASVPTEDTAAPSSSSSPAEQLWLSHHPPQQPSTHTQTQAQALTQGHSQAPAQTSSQDQTLAQPLRTASPATFYAPYTPDAATHSAAHSAAHRSHHHSHNHVYGHQHGPSITPPAYSSVNAGASAYGTNTAIRAGAGALHSPMGYRSLAVPAPPPPITADHMHDVWAAAPRRRHSAPRQRCGAATHGALGRCIDGNPRSNACGIAADSARGKKEADLEMCERATHILGGHESPRLTRTRGVTCARTLDDVPVSTLSPRTAHTHLQASSSVPATLRGRRGARIPTWTSSRVCGLSNLGNTCYLNSALQCLLATPAIARVIAAVVTAGEVVERPKEGEKNSTRVHGVSAGVGVDGGVGGQQAVAQPTAALQGGYLPVTSTAPVTSATTAAVNADSLASGVHAASAADVRKAAQEAEAETATETGEYEGEEEEDAAEAEEEEVLIDGDEEMSVDVSVSRSVSVAVRRPFHSHSLSSACTHTSSSLALAPTTSLSSLPSVALPSDLNMLPSGTVSIASVSSAAAPGVALPTMPPPKLHNNASRSNVAIPGTVAIPEKASHTTLPAPAAGPLPPPPVTHNNTTTIAAATATPPRRPSPILQALALTLRAMVTRAHALPLVAPLATASTGTSSSVTTSTNIAGDVPLPSSLPHAAAARSLASRAGARWRRVGAPTATHTHVLHVPAIADARPDTLNVPNTSSTNGNTNSGGGGVGSGAKGKEKGGPNTSSNGGKDKAVSIAPSSSLKPPANLPSYSSASASTASTSASTSPLALLTTHTVLSSTSAAQCICGGARLLPRQLALVLFPHMHAAHPHTAGSSTFSTSTAIASTSVGVAELPLRATASTSALAPALTALPTSTSTSLNATLSANTNVNTNSNSDVGSSSGPSINVAAIVECDVARRHSQQQRLAALAGVGRDALVHATDSSSTTATTASGPSGPTGTADSDAAMSSNVDGAVGIVGNSGVLEQGVALDTLDGVTLEMLPCICALTTISTHTVMHSATHSATQPLLNPARASPSLSTGDTQKNAMTGVEADTAPTDAIDAVGNADDAGGDMARSADEECASTLPVIAPENPVGQLGTTLVFSCHAATTANTNASTNSNNSTATTSSSKVKGGTTTTSSTSNSAPQSTSASTSVSTSVCPLPIPAFSAIATAAIPLTTSTAPRVHALASISSSHAPLFPLTAPAALSSTRVMRFMHAMGYRGSLRRHGQRMHLPVQDADAGNITNATDTASNKTATPAAAAITGSRADSLPSLASFPSLVDLRRLYTLHHLPTVFSAHAVLAPTILRRALITHGGYIGDAVSWREQLDAQEVCSWLLDHVHEQGKYPVRRVGVREWLRLAQKVSGRAITATTAATIKDADVGAAQEVVARGELLTMRERATKHTEEAKDVVVKGDAEPRGGANVEKVEEEVEVNEKEDGEDALEDEAKEMEVVNVVDVEVEEEQQVDVSVAPCVSSASWGERVVALVARGQQHLLARELYGAQSDSLPACSAASLAPAPGLPQLKTAQCENSLSCPRVHDSSFSTSSAQLALPLSGSSLEVLTLEDALMLYWRGQLTREAMVSTSHAHTHTHESMHVSKTCSSDACADDSRTAAPETVTDTATGAVSTSDKAIAAVLGQDTNATQQGTVITAISPPTSPENQISGKNTKNPETAYIPNSTSESESVKGGAASLSDISLLADLASSPPAPSSPIKSHINTSTSFASSSTSPAPHPTLPTLSLPLLSRAAAHWAHHVRRSASPLLSVLTGQSVTHTLCTHCGYLGEAFESFAALPLPVFVNERRLVPVRGRGGQAGTSSDVDCGNVDDGVGVQGTSRDSAGVDAAVPTDVKDTKDGKNGKNRKDKASTRTGTTSPPATHNTHNSIPDIAPPPSTGDSILDTELTRLHSLGYAFADAEAVRHEGTGVYVQRLRQLLGRETSKDAAKNAATATGKGASTKNATAGPLSPAAYGTGQHGTSRRVVGSVSESLREYTCVEYVREADGWRCTQCAVPRPGLRRTLLLHAPPTLVAAMQRFSHTGKCSAPVHYPLQGLSVPTVADMLPRRVSPADADENDYDAALRGMAVTASGFSETQGFAVAQSLSRLSTHAVTPADTLSSRYSLVAQCLHVGSTSGGHYTAQCKTSVGWVDFNDCCARSLPSRMVCSPYAYLLFLEKENMGVCQFDDNFNNDVPLLAPTFAAEGMWPQMPSSDQSTTPQVLERCGLWPHTRIARALLSQATMH